jgi:prepilin-type N-terminal cleavage/methylation domain-containing protein
MGAEMMVARIKAPAAVERSRGFALIEVMIAVVILLIGLLAMVGVFGYALATTQTVQEDQVAKQKAQELMENIFTARDTQQITFAQIANTPGGIFVQGLQPLMDTGPDGLAGTGDDIAFDPAVTGCPGSANPNGVECIKLPGPDGLLGTSDDTFMVLGNFQRQIQIQNWLNPDGTINPNLKQVTVTIRYTRPGIAQARTYTVNALISSYR